MIYSNILETIGNTPSVKIKNISINNTNIYVKAEYFNPASSVKDRLAISIIENAEKNGSIEKGQTVVEATSGNTGIGLAMVCAAKNYPLVVTMPDSASIEGRKLMRFLGARVILTPASEGGTGAYKIAKRIKELNDKVDVFAITSVVDQVTPFKYRLKTYSRIFQALRIATNDELNHLKFFLDNFIDLLSPQGRIVVISYHSIEDRIVKHKFKDLKNKKKMNLIYKKPLIPSKEEVGLNKRARSAKMRVGEKIG